MCTTPMERVGEGAATDTLVTCRDQQLEHTFKPRCVVHAAARLRVRPSPYSYPYPYP